MPIDIATGDVELVRDDFVLPGRVPIKWTRHYRSELLNSSNSPLGSGWTTSWLPTLKRAEHAWEFVTPEGVKNTFPDPEGRLRSGHVIRLLGAFLELTRQDNRYVVTQWDVESSEIQCFVFNAESVSDDTPLIAIENVSGDGVDVVWEAPGRLKSFRQRVENRTLLVSYSAAGRICSLALRTKEGARAELVRYEYDAAGRLDAVIDRRGLANRYEYDDQSRIIREIYKDGEVYSYRYDDHGRCVRVSGLNNYNEKRLQFIDAANRTTVTNSYGKTSIFERTPSGQISAELDPAGNQRRTIFDEFNRIIAKIDPTGATTRYTYDQNGNRDSITDPLGNTYRYEFNEHRQPVSVTDPLGRTWHREFDARRRLVSSSNPLGARWQIGYDQAGNHTVITDPLGSTRHFRSADGLVQEMTDWMGHSTRFAWDEFGRVTERIGPLGERTAFLYDLVGNPVEVELPDGGRLRSTYDTVDNLTSFTNVKGHTTRLRYGYCRRLLERVDPIGRVIRYGWGTEPARLDRVINEKGETFNYIRNDLGQVVRERSFDGREQSFEYDAVGRCIAVTNGNGEKILFKRNAAGMLVEQALPDGATTSYEYDSSGQIIAAVSPDIPVTFEYDDAGRLVREVQGKEWVRTEYNAAGEVIRTETSLGHQIRYELDPNGRIAKLTTANNQSLTFERDARGLETGRQIPGGFRLEQRFDSMGRLLQQRVGRPSLPAGMGAISAEESRNQEGYEVIRRDYGYDVDGLLLSILDGQWGTTDYAYDPAERLLNALRGQGLNEHFQYDSTDNITRTQQRGREANDNSSTYSVGNRLLQCGQTRYEYDPDGRLVRKSESSNGEKPKVWEFIWDPQAQLRKVRCPDGREYSYKYDAFGRRVAKIETEFVRHFLWDGEVIIHERQDSDKPTFWVMQRSSFAPLAKIYEGELFTLITDHLGTPREMLSPSGGLVWAATHTAWGKVERKISTLAEHECPFRFQGQWFDEESGLHYNRFRYYIPHLARFASQDPIGTQGDINLYAYVRNPISQFDPLGLTESKCSDPLPDEAEVVKGGLAKKSRIDTFEEPGVGTVTGTSASSEPGKTVAQLSEGIPNGQVRTTTVGAIRAAGGDVIPTRRNPNNPNHVTITGLTSDQIDRVLGPPIPNPAR